MFYRLVEMGHLANKFIAQVKQNTIAAEEEKIVMQLNNLFNDYRLPRADVLHSRNTHMATALNFLTAISSTSDVKTNFKSVIIGSSKSSNGIVIGVEHEMEGIRVLTPIVIDDVKWNSKLDKQLVKQFEDYATDHNLYLNVEEYLDGFFTYLVDPNSPSLANNRRIVTSDGGSGSSLSAALFRIDLLTQKFDFETKIPRSKVLYFGNDYIQHLMNQFMENKVSLKLDDSNLGLQSFLIAGVNCLKIKFPSLQLFIEDNYDLITDTDFKTITSEVRAFDMPYHIDGFGFQIPNVFIGSDIAKFESARTIVKISNDRIDNIGKVYESSYYVKMHPVHISEPDNLNCIQIITDEFLSYEMQHEFTEFSHLLTDLPTIPVGKFLNGNNLVKSIANELIIAVKQCNGLKNTPAYFFGILKRMSHIFTSIEILKPEISEMFAFGNVFILQASAKVRLCFNIVHPYVSNSIFKVVL